MRYTGNILAVSRIPIPEVFQDSRHGQVAGIHIQIPLPFRLCAPEVNGHASPWFPGRKKSAAFRFWEGGVFYSTVLSLTISPSGEMVKMRRGSFLPLAAMAFFTAVSRPPQQGTSIRVSVMLAMVLFAKIAASFSL